MKNSCCLLAALLCAVSPAAAGEPVPQKTVLESATGEFWTVGEDTFFVFNGNADKRVTLMGTNLKIVCDHLEMTAVGIGEKNATLPTLDKFKYLLATGRVNIVQGSREASCGRAEVFPREDKIVLTEDPVVVDHANGARVDGAKITMLRGQQRVLVDKPKFEGPPIKNLGFEPKDPAPAAPAPGRAAPPTSTPPR
jgi:lipopolysaccharide export system protein LptA